MANQAPDEIVSEILSPLLKHSDDVFSDVSEKPLVSGYSSSTYLLVCKAWLRVSTPLLYNVVILRTTAQAAALEQVLTANPEFGLFIKKLRVEGGFGQAMRTILKSAPTITDLFLKLSIWGSDNVAGLCGGLPLINPRRVILVDGDREIFTYMKPKKNKQVTQLLEMLIRCIPKWDKLLIFDFPYVQVGEMLADPTYDARARALASALSKSKSLETLLVCAGSGFPPYLHQMCDAPSLKSMCLTYPIRWGDGLYDDVDPIRQAIDADPKLKALVKYNSKTSTRDANTMLPDPLSPLSTESLVAEAPVEDIQTLKELGESSGTTLQELIVRIRGLTPGSKLRMPVANPTVLSCFTALTRLEWSSPTRLAFSTPAPGFSALPSLHKISITECSPSFFAVLSNLSLDALRDVSIESHLDVPASLKFLQAHGSKLLELSAPLDVVVNLRVFNHFTALNTVVAIGLSPNLKPERRVLPEDFLACNTPHMSLVKIGLPWIERHNKGSMEQICATLDTTNFPVLKEIQVCGLEWPTSEQKISKNEWVKLSGLLHPKGIVLTDLNGVSWTRH
ncbi:hypothetical protein DFH09DRAFT_999999 [Mycena vulgaris]|nr:hypothetical protein DFH09DRAFT_999999 [Mycena vulgaris]